MVKVLERTGAVDMDVVRVLAHWVQESKDAHPNFSQEALAKWIHKDITQSDVSRLLARIKNPPPEKMPPMVGPATLALFARKYGFDKQALYDGTIIANRGRVDTMNPNRGAAFFFLSLGNEFPPELLDALRDQPPPDGSDRWTPRRWAKYIERQINAWKDGELVLPGVKHI